MSPSSLFGHLDIFRSDYFLGFLDRWSFGSLLLVNRILYFWFYQQKSRLMRYLELPIFLESLYETSDLRRRIRVMPTFPKSVRIVDVQMRTLPKRTDSSLIVVDSIFLCFSSRRHFRVLVWKNIAFVNILNQRSLDMSKFDYGRFVGSDAENIYFLDANAQPNLLRIVGEIEGEVNIDFMMRPLFFHDETLFLLEGSEIISRKITKSRDSYFFENSEWEHFLHLDEAPRRFLFFVQRFHYFCR